MENNNLKADFAAGFSVALVALPLSIGIALASGAPASAGLIAAIIGGILGSWTGGSKVTINGPAAGLIVIVLDAINSLGFSGFLAAAVVAGALQVVMGLFKFARKGSAFPASVIHGMMAAIGIIIIAKQTHIMIGHTPVAKNPIMLLAEIPMSFSNFKTSVFFTGVLTLALLIGWNKISNPVIKKVPGPLIAVIFGAFLAHYFGLGGTDLLKVPSELSKWFLFPDFSVMTSTAGWMSAITLCLVGTLETTLSAAAVDKIDPLKRKTDLDRDLISKGICNMLSSAIGGLPMIAEIVRSSANVSFGAKTWKANFFHGAIIMLAVLILPTALSYIPLAALAAILCMVGWRLGNPVHLHHALKVGFDNLVGFAVTLFVTLGVDLLAGIFFGALAQFAVEMFLGLKLKHAIKPSYKIESGNLTVESALTFSNFLVVKDVITKHLDQNKDVHLDLTMSGYVDHSVMEQIHELKKLFQEKNIELSVTFSGQHRAIGENELSAIKKAA